MEKIVLNQVSNPGISFTKDVNEKILALYYYLNSNQNIHCSYQQFQEHLINNNIFTGSYIRSFIPFLYNTGHEMILVIRAPKLILPSDEQL